MPTARTPRSTSARAASSRQVGEVASGSRARPSARSCRCGRARCRPAPIGASASAAASTARAAAEIDHQRLADHAIERRPRRGAAPPSMKWYGASTCVPVWLPIASSETLQTSPSTMRLHVLDVRLRVARVDVLARAVRHRDVDDPLEARRHAARPNAAARPRRSRRACPPRATSAATRIASSRFGGRRCSCRRCRRPCRARSRCG